jgi:hypothetical protein
VGVLWAPTMPTKDTLFTVGVCAVTGTVLGLFARWVSQPRSLGRLPLQMRQLRLVEPNYDVEKIVLEVVEVPMPTPGRNEVLVRMVRPPSSGARGYPTRESWGHAYTAHLDAVSCYLIRARAQETSWVLWCCH